MANEPLLPLLLVRIEKQNKVKKFGRLDDCAATFQLVSFDGGSDSSSKAEYPVFAALVRSQNLHLVSLDVDLVENKV